MNYKISHKNLYLFDINKKLNKKYFIQLYFAKKLLVHNFFMLLNFNI